MFNAPPYDPPAEPPSTAAPPLLPEPPRALVESFWTDWSRIEDRASTVASGRLVEALRSRARSRDALAILADAALEHVAAARSRGDLTFANAVADLAVTGRAAFAGFQRTPHPTRRCSPPSERG